jgi:hypothetical protein
VIEAVHKLVDECRITVSEAVRSALLAHRALDPSTRQYTTLLYEIAKTRCVLLRLLDTQVTQSQVDHLLSLAEGDATGSVRERLEQEARPGQGPSLLAGGHWAGGAADA